MAQKLFICEDLVIQRFSSQFDRTTSIRCGKNLIHLATAELRKIQHHRLKAELSGIDPAEQQYLFHQLRHPSRVLLDRE